MTITLYAHPQSPPCRSVSILLELLDVSHEYKFVDLMKGEHEQPWFKQVLQLNFSVKRVLRFSLISPPFKKCCVINSD